MKNKTTGHNTGTVKDTQASPCLCAAIRKAARVVTKQYDEHLKQSGLRITQYSILANILRNPGISVSELAKVMVMDQTTVTRNLQILKKQHYVFTRGNDDDQRIKSVFISDLGKQIFEQARPLWIKAQQEIEGNLGTLGFDVFMQSLKTVVG